MKFNVTVIRIGYRQTEVAVEADHADDAQAKAVERAADLEFPGEHDVEYESIATEIQE
jgi:hypothetical protein